LDDPPDTIKDTDPSIDATMVAGNLKLKLTINISGLWRPQFEFVLKAMELDTIEVLKAHLRDAQDEIKALKETKHACVYLSVCSQTSIGYQQLVTWNGTTTNLITDTHFERSADTTTITIKKRGVYQINCRLGQTNSSNCQCLTLLINGSAIARCLQADANGYQNTAHITEVLEIAAGSTLTVQCGADGSSLADQLQNRLSIVLLHAL
jgi:hypothetical protein